MKTVPPLFAVAMLIAGCSGSGTSDAQGEEAKASGALAGPAEVASDPGDPITGIDAASGSAGAMPADGGAVPTPAAPREGRTKPATAAAPKTGTVETAPAANAAAAANVAAPVANNSAGATR